MTDETQTTPQADETPKPRKPTPAEELAAARAEHRRTRKVPSGYAYNVRDGLYKKSGKGK